VSEQVRRKLKVAMQENARLKAEVERLTFDPLTYLDDGGEWMPRHTHLAAVARLQAQVERLTKLLGMCESVDNAIDVWIESKIQAAKEGETK